MVCPLAKSMAWVNHWPIFMSHMLRLVLVVFRAFPKPTGSSARHERDTECEFLPPARARQPRERCCRRCVLVVEAVSASPFFPHLQAGGAYPGLPSSPRWPPLFVNLSAGNLCVVHQVERRTRRCAMRPQEIGIAERTEEIAWRHVWLKSVLIDGNSFPTKIYRPRPTRRMSVTRRLEKLHRMRAALGQQRSWMAR
jgi:hypothetical protein